MTAPDVNANVRARFEADIVRFYGHKPGRTFDRSKDGNYKSGTVQAAWNGYYIARAAVAGEVREWRSIENPPSVSTTASHPVLVYSPEVGVRMGWYTKAYADKGEWPWSADGFCALTNKRLTHWMPRPAEPATLAKFHPTHREKP